MGLKEDVEELKKNKRQKGRKKARRNIDKICRWNFCVFFWGRRWVARRKTYFFWRTRTKNGRNI